jgi:ketosteroid isomerase-like protein
MTNTQIVRDAYAAFLRGDVAALLELLDDHVVWKPITGAAPYVPTGGERRGKASVGEFFQTLGQTITFEQFEPRQYVAEGDTVVALGHYRATTSTGKSFESDWVMVFTIRNDKIASFQEFTDVAAINDAFKGLVPSA